MIDRVMLKRTAKERLAAQSPSVYLITVAYLVIATVLSILVGKLSGAEDAAETFREMIDSGQVLNWEDWLSAAPKVTFFPSLLVFLINIVSTVLAVGYMSLCLKAHRGQKVAFGDIFDGFNHFFKVVWLSILMGIFIFLWTLLLIIPGIVAVYRYRLSMYILLDNPNMSALDCISESKRLMRGHKMELFVCDLSFIGWVIVGGIVESGIGYFIGVSLPLFSIWLEPYMGITYAGFYLALAGTGEQSGENTPDWEPKL